MKLKKLIRKLEQLQSEYGGEIEVLSGDDHERLTYAECYYRDSAVWLQFRVPHPVVTNYDLMEPNEAIAYWISRNVQLLPEGSPEALDLWEKATSELLRLSIPENVAVVHEVDVHLKRGESKRPDVVNVSIKHVFGVFEGAFLIREHQGQAKLSALPIHDVVEV